MRLFHAKDLAEINTWYERHGRPPVAIDMLPLCGAFEPGVAAGFLYLTDSGLGLLEGFVTNPEASGETRHQALEAITRKLTMDAREHRVSVLIALFQDPSIAARAERHGFGTIGAYTMAAKELR